MQPEIESTTAHDSPTERLRPIAAAPSDIATLPRTRQTLRKALVFGALVLVPTAVGAAVTAITRSRRAGTLAAGSTALGLGLARFQLQRMVSQEPAFTVEQHIGELEVRRYAPFVAAQVELAAADANQALERGFDILFAYIGRGNVTDQKLEMTAPIITGRTGETFTVAFVMPMGRTIASLPLPGDARVTLVEVPARRMAVMTYRGRFSAESIEQHEHLLVRLVAYAGLSPVGEPAFAGFDPPTTLPFLRRNEVWLELRHA